MILPVFTYCNLAANLATLSYSNTRKRQICNIERRGLNIITFGLENMYIRIPSTDSYMKRKVCLYVFDCLLGNVCMPFKNYFTRTKHNFNTRNRFSSVELPKMKLGRQSFYFLGAIIYNSLALEIRKLNSRDLFRQKVNEHFYL